METEKSSNIETLQNRFEEPEWMARLAKLLRERIEVENIQIPRKVIENQTKIFKVD